MSRHVVVLTRDASLVVAVRALLDAGDRVSELESPQELPSLGDAPVNAVVVDLPTSLRPAAVERVRGQFSAPLVVLLSRGEDPEKARGTYRCSVLVRPFGMAQLWSLLVSSSTSPTEVLPVVHADESAPARTGRGDSAASRAGWGGRAGRGDSAGRAGWGGRGGPGGSRAEAEQAEESGPDGRPSQPGQADQGPGQRPGQGPDHPRQPGRRPDQFGVKQAPRAPGQQQRPASVTRTEPAWEWRVRRFQHTLAESPAEGTRTEPMPPVPPPGNGAGAGEAPVTDASVPLEVPQKASAPPEVPRGATAPPEVPRDARDQKVSRDVQDAGDARDAGDVRDAMLPDPSEAVAGRLAERLHADTVALLLDNNQGLLEVAGGVGLTPAERQLQVEYGHEILRELFRVGVGLIEDTERVGGLLNGMPGSRCQTLVMVPLVHEGHGFGALVAGRRSRPDHPRPAFTELEIEALMDFAEDVAAPLRGTVLLRRLKGQLDDPGQP